MCVCVRVRAYCSNGDYFLKVVNVNMYEDTVEPGEDLFTDR